MIKKAPNLIVKLQMSMYYQEWQFWITMLMMRVQLILVKYTVKVNEVIQ
ncbi:hypothetical protein [Pelosinus propionicus]|uniref:Uncharacterized protein n=1 Tax=Pelosinus propionicus DSM 13327 TaxID=1123291 RepID=A0A1I4GPP2_9FIRM|nr:hypothetical protein [Pelosinus propionicus]SFL31357.1 hypothetical protein SAMN04490355_100155 [Pelosinus propionicus DSM 13327]